MADNWKSSNAGSPSSFGSTPNNRAFSKRPSFFSLFIALVFFVLLPVVGIFLYNSIGPTIKKIQTASAPEQTPAKIGWLRGNESHMQFGNEWVGAAEVSAGELLMYATTYWDLYSESRVSRDPNAISVFDTESKALFARVFGESGRIGITTPPSNIAGKQPSPQDQRLQFEVATGERELPDGGSQTIRVFIRTKLDFKRVSETILIPAEQASDATSQVRIIIVPFYTEVSEQRKTVRGIDAQNKSRLGFMNKWVTQSEVTVSINVDFVGAQIVTDGEPTHSLIKGAIRPNPQG